MAETKKARSAGGGAAQLGGRGFAHAGTCNQPAHLA